MTLVSNSQSEFYSETTTRSTGYTFYLIFFLGATAMLDAIFSYSELIAIPFILSEYDISLSTFSYWQSIIGLLSLFVFIPSWFADRYGRKHGMLLLLVLMTIPSILIGFIGPSNFLIFIILYGIVIFGANMNLWAIPITEEAPPHRRARYVQYVGIFSFIPVIVVVGIPIATKWGWQWIYGIMGLCGLLLIGLWVFMKETQVWIADEHMSGTNLSYFERLRLLDKSQWIFVAFMSSFYLAWGTVFKIMNSTVGVFFMDIQGYSLVQYQNILYFAFALSLVGVLSIGFIMEKIGRKFGFLYSSIGAGSSFFLLAKFGTPIFVFACFYFLTCSFGFLVVHSPEILPTQVRSTGNGVMLTISRLGFVLGPGITYVVLGSEVNAASFSVLYTIAGTLLISPILFLLVYKFVETKGKSLSEIQVAQKS